MPHKIAIYDYGDVTAITYPEFLKQHPDFPHKRWTFQRYKRQQLQNNISEKNARSIIRKQDNNAQDRQNPNNQDTQKPTSPIDLSLEDRKLLVCMAVESLKKHIPTQWQAAATTLERLIPSQFAKRDAPAGLQQAIGIKITIGAREHTTDSTQAVNVQVDGQDVK